MSAAPDLSLVERSIAAVEPPWSLEIEQALLGALLRGPSAYLKVCDRLDPEHFFAEIHQRIYMAYAKLADAGQAATTVTLSPMFKDDPALRDVGGAKYLVDVFRSAVTIINAEQYADQVIDLWRRRRAIEIAEGVVLQAREMEIDYTIEDVIADAQSRLDFINERAAAEQESRPIGATMDAVLEAAESAYQNPGKLSGLSTGIETLDRRIGGLHRSHLLILAGRPSMGKTALATNIAFNVARSYRSEVDPATGRQITTAGGVVAFYSLEMSDEELGTRVLATESGIPADALKRGHVSREQMDRFIQTRQLIEDLPLIINDTAAMPIGRIRSDARRIKRQRGLDLIIVDYLQLISSPGGARSEKNRVQEVTEITKALKGLAKELDVPVIALSQLSRALETREDKRPQLSDLRESGSIEQDADVVMFVYRDEYYIERAEPSRRDGESADKFGVRVTDWQNRMIAAKGQAEVIVGKQRHGPIGKCVLRFDGPLTKFSDIQTGAYDYDQ